MAAIDPRGRVMANIKKSYDKENPSVEGLEIGPWSEIIKENVPSFRAADKEPTIAEAFLDMAGDNQKHLTYNVFEHCICKKTLNTEQQLRSIFRSLDRDGNGCADKDELREFFSNKSRSLKEEDVEKLLDGADTNKDGKIDAEEFINCWKGKGKGSKK